MARIVRQPPGQRHPWPQIEARSIKIPTGRAASVLAGRRCETPKTSGSTNLHSESGWRRTWRIQFGYSLIDREMTTEITHLLLKSCCSQQVADIGMGFHQ